MSRILIILVVLLLIGGGGGAYFYMGNADASVEAADAAVKTEPVKNYVYVPMSPILLPVIGRNGVSHTVTIVVSLQVANDADAALVRNRLPVLTDAFLSDMYGSLSRQAAMEGGVLRVSVVKDRLKGAAARVVPDGQIQDILLQVLQQYQN